MFIAGETTAMTSNAIVTETTNATNIGTDANDFSLFIIYYSLSIKG